MARYDTDDIRLAMKGIDVLKAQAIADFDARLERLRALLNGNHSAASKKVERALTLAQHSPSSKKTTRGKTPGINTRAYKAAVAQLREQLVTALRETPAGLTTRELAQRSGETRLRRIAMTLLLEQKHGRARFRHKRWQLITKGAATRSTKRTTSTKRATKKITRRSGATIQAQLVDAIRGGTSRFAQLLEAIYPKAAGVKGDQQVSRALKTLTKAGTIRKTKDRSYVLAEATS